MLAAQALSWEAAVEATRVFWQTFLGVRQMSAVWSWARQAAQLCLLICLTGSLHTASA